MIREHAQQHWPNCVDAVLYHEAHMTGCGEMNDPEKFWEKVRRTDFSPDEVVNIIASLAPSQALAAQCRHPDFLCYVAGRMGAY